MKLILQTYKVKAGQIAQTVQYVYLNLNIFIVYDA